VFRFKKQFLENHVGYVAVLKFGSQLNIIFVVMARNSAEDQRQ